MASPHHHVTAPRHRSPTLPVVRLRPVSQAATHDERWPAVAVALAGLRERKRCAVRIVDADCGAGCLLLHALRFTAIEGRRIAGAPALIDRARATETAQPAIFDALRRAGQPLIGIGDASPAKMAA